MNALRHEFARVAEVMPAKAPRRKKKPSGRSITVRFTKEEAARLEREAGERTLSAYIRSRLLGKKEQRGPDRRRSVDLESLARVLAVLGQSGIGPNVAEIAAAARSGTLEIGPMLKATLAQACADIAMMRSELIGALGVKAE